MLTGENKVKIKVNNSELILFLTSLYEIYGSKELEIYNKGEYVTGAFSAYYNINKEVYRINTGSSFIDIAGDTEIVTSKGVKKVKDLRNSDLISCYEEDKDFSNNGVAFKSIYSISQINNYYKPLYSCNKEFTLENNIIIGAE